LDEEYGPLSLLMIFLNVIRFISSRFFYGTSGVIIKSSVCF
jgi:hypothetical protein